jgi:endonuclease/exonuclease/phosphatase family metal-dependent hydrolase
MLNVKYDIVAVEIVKHQVKIGSYNLRSCAGGEEGRLQLSVLARELEGVDVKLCGLQELCSLHVGECDIVIPSSIQGHRGEGD